MRRILALWLPRLSTDRLRRKDASLSKAPPLVVSGKASNALYVHALEARAQKSGLYKGQPLANARAMVPNLTIIPADAKKDAELLEQIAEWCDRFTPYVAADPPEGLILDITGAAHLFGGEAAMLELVRGKIAAQGFCVQAAIAGTPSAARALARFASGHIAAPGAEAESLARLPVTALGFGAVRVAHEQVRGTCESDERAKRKRSAEDEKNIAALIRAGLKNIGQVKARGRDELAARFGKEFVTRLEALLGQHDEPVNPRRPLPDLMAEQRFAEPVVTQDAIMASLLSLAQSLGEVLEKRGLGLRQLEASFFRADGVVRRIALRLGGASRDAERVLRLLQEKLDTLRDPLDPGFGFDVIRLEALLAEKAEASAVSLDSHEQARREIQHLADRLSVRHGEARVLRFVAQDTHIPEGQSAGVPAQDRDFMGLSRQDGPWPKRRRESDPPLRPLRLFEKPEEIFAALDTPPDGAPAFFRWRRARFDVARAEGPERIAMEWWKGEKPTRDYFRVETNEGQRFWLYRDGLYARQGFHPRWYLHGIFA